jgi:hypothetical protein
MDKSRVHPSDQVRSARRTLAKPPAGAGGACPHPGGCRAHSAVRASSCVAAAAARPPARRGRRRGVSPRRCDRCVWFWAVRLAARALPAGLRGRFGSSSHRHDGAMHSLASLDMATRRRFWWIAPPTGRGGCLNPLKALPARRRGEACASARYGRPPARVGLTSPRPERRGGRTCQPTANQWEAPALLSRATSATADVRLGLSSGLQNDSSSRRPGNRRD